MAFLGTALMTMGSSETGVSQVLVSGSLEYGPGIVWQGEEPVSVDSSAIHIPLNFWLESKGGSPLTAYAEQATDDRVRQFLSIGLIAVGRDYGFNGSACTYAITRPTDHSTQGTPRGGLQQEFVQYQVAVAVQCFETTELEWSTSTKLMKTLLSIDPGKSPQLLYKSRFTADVSAIIYATKLDRVLFDVGTHVQLQRQPKFAAKDQFRVFSELDQTAIDQLRNDIRNRLVQAYAASLSSVGLQTEAVEPTRAQ